MSSDVTPPGEPRPLAEPRPAGPPAACGDCLRRSWLLARLAGRLDIAFHRRRPVRDVLALDDAQLIPGLAGDQAPPIAAELDAVRPADLRAHAAAAGLSVVCRHDARYPA